MMKFFSPALAMLALLSGVHAVDRKLSVIVSFDPNTPEKVVASARQQILNDGGIITHDYQIIKLVSLFFPRFVDANLVSRGFSAIAFEKSLEMVQTSGSGYSIRVEEDQVVTANN